MRRDLYGLGWFIGRISIDEFQQFWNVLKEDISLMAIIPPAVDDRENMSVIIESEWQSNRESSDCGR